MGMGIERKMKIEEEGKGFLDDRVNVLVLEGMDEVMGNEEVLNGIGDGFGLVVILKKDDGGGYDVVCWEKNGVG